MAPQGSSNGLVRWLVGGLVGGAILLGLLIGAYAIGYDRGHEKATKVAPQPTTAPATTAPAGTTLAASSCVSCGACVDTCPTGALVDKSVLSKGLPSSWTRSTCAYCGVGCEVLVGTRENRVVEIRPPVDALVNRGHLCVKGRYAFQYVEAKDRITVPMIQTDGAWTRVSWRDAVQFVVDREI